ncbi:hypothetical protein P1J78_04110 [Psychromarinibacter sp. C21-152]|uniref:MerR HTH family regulatory protein n=1 Tax=Psychromarinibacter sediminicola TaxID=3033385 RepID=A0AAE3NQP6_9RHOB|nr:hypothetical protein [Psychromarinibacter sediminicola]MDF0599909.1 hypothetical protein [Psychromarinibacter sediminicola]
MQLTTRQFTSQQVADATDLTHKSVQNWAARGLIVGHSGGGGKGRARLFSWENLMEFAVAAAVLRLGIATPQEAFSAAREFAHFGEGPAGYAEWDDPAEPDRKIAMPYHHQHGETFMLIFGEQAKIVAITDGKIPLSAVNVGGTGDPSAFIAVNVSKVFNKVCTRLGLDPSAVLDEVYRVGSSS